LRDFGYSRLFLCPTHCSCWWCYWGYLCPTLTRSTSAPLLHFPRSTIQRTILDLSN
jgi:hypothetical protein